MYDAEAFLAASHDCVYNSCRADSCKFHESVARLEANCCTLRRVLTGCNSKKDPFSKRETVMVFHIVQSPSRGRLRCQISNMSKIEFAKVLEAVGKLQDLNVSGTGCR